MSTIQREGWQSLTQTEREQSAPIYVGSGNTTYSGIKAAREKATWCNLLAVLQQRHLTGFRMSLLTPGDPVGKGKYFAVWRHRIRDEHERFTYQDQDREILPVGTVLALKRVIPLINSKTGEIILDDAKQLQAVSLEVRALTVPKLRQHPNIVTLIGIVWEPRGSDTAAWPTLVLEYCDATLSECQKTIPHPLPIQEKLRLAKGVAAGLAAIHSLGMVHGDIKSENVLLKFDNTGTPTPKLADFGCSLVDLESLEEGVRSEKVWIGGTNPWRAPECVEHNGLVTRGEALATDFFSLGLLLLRLLNDDKDPFATCGQVSNMVPNELDNDAKEIMKRSPNFPNQAKDMAISLAPSHATVSMFAEIIHRLLEIKPTVRLERVASVELELPTLGFSFFQPKNTTNETYKAQWDAVWEKHASASPIISVRDLRRDEILDEERRYTAATRKKIFEELHSLFQASRSIMTVCPGCCFISAFDAEPNERPPDLGVEDYFKAAQEEKPLHTCMSNALEPLPTASLPEGSFWTDDRAALQLFTCFLDGVGVDASVDKALDCLVSGAERGITGFQSDLPVLFNMFQRPLPRQIPLRKWMMNGVFLGNFDGSSKLLAQSEPHLFEIARQARLYAYNGISFLTKNIELQPNAAELPSGYSILHMAAGSIEEPLDYIRRLCAPSAWKKFKSILVKRADRKGEVLDVDITCNDGDTPLLVACRAQRRRVIDLLLTLGASVTRAAYSSKDTPLHWLALMYDSKAFIERIINRGANIDAVSERCLKNPPWIFGGLTNLPKIIRARGSPLLWAVTTGNVENAGCLVELGANIDLAHPEGFTPLEAAVFMGRPEIVKVLLRKVSPSYVISRRVFSKLVVDPTLTKQCIEQHSEADQVEIVKLLTPFCPRESLEEVYEFFKFSIKHAVKGLGYALVEEILLCLDKCSTACGAVSGKPLDDDAWRRWTLSLTAVQRHDTRILGTVLRFGAHLHPETLHTLASDGGNTECIPILLEHGARLDSHNLNGPFTSFGFAVLYGNIDVAESLRGHMTAEQLGHALGRATYGGLETKSGRRLTLLGAIISFLHVSYEHIKGVEYLFTLPPELDACNFIVQLDPPFSALQLVLDDFNLNEGFFQEFSGLPLFRFLLSKFSEPHHLNATDSTGYAALHSAAWLAKPEECELLVEAGADINLMAEENRTPLDCCFLFPPRGMGIREGGLGPTREMIRRFEENRNACAVYLRSRGARSGIFEISKDSTMEEFRLPFPEKWSSANYATHQM